MKKLNVEEGELIIRNSKGNIAVIPAYDRNKIKSLIEKGCNNCVNEYVSGLPLYSDYAEDGSLVPDDGDPIKKETYEQWGDRIRKIAPNLDYTKDGDYNYRGAYEAGLEPVEVDNNGVKEYHLGSRNPKTGEILKYRSHPTFNQAISEDVKMGYVPYEKDGRIYTVDRKSKEYKDLYDSGKLLGYDRVNDLYIAPDLGGATIKATKPQWMKDKEALEKEYSKDWYIDNNLPKFSRSMGVSPNNMGGNQKGYDEYINNKLAESILKRNPNFDKDYSNNRLKTLSNYSQKELEIIKNSNLSYKVEPSIWSKFEQGLLSVGNAGSPVTFKNENLTQKEAKKEDNPLNILQPLSVPSKMVQSVYKKDYSLKDALKGKQNNAGIVEDIVTDPLNFAGVGLAGKLSKADKAIDATKILNKIDNNSFYRQIGKEGYEDAIKTGVIRSKPTGEYAGKAPYFVEGKDFDKLYSTGAGAYGKKPEYIFEMSQLKNPEEMSAFRVNHQAEYSPYVAGSKEIPISQGKIYRLNNKNEYEIVDATKAGSKVLNKTDDVKIFNSILYNPKEIEAITNNIKDISKEDIIKLEGYLKDTYDYENLTPWQRQKLLDRESYYLKKNNISVSDRIENDKKLLNFWEDYKKERKTYFESPKFRERLEKQVGKMDDEAFDKYKSNLLNNLEKRPYIRPDIVADYSAAHYKPKSHIGISEHSPGHTYYTDESIEKGIVEHEGRHQLTNADDVLYGFPSQQELEANLVHPDLLSIEPDFIRNVGDRTGREYFLSPEEFIVRLDELKRDLSKVGYDYMTEDLTPEILKKYKGITPKEAIRQVTGKSYGVRLNELLPEQHKQVLQLLDNNIEQTKDASRLLRWFKEDFLINQINNKWGLIPPAIGSGMYLQSQKQNKTEQ